MAMEYSRKTMMHPHLITRTAAAAALLVAIIVVLQLPVALAAPAADMHHLHFFMHDGYPTAMVIVNGTTPRQRGIPGFGETTVIDDMLTEGPGRASRLVGHAQGTYVMSSREVGRSAVLMSMNVVLTDYHGYTGSTVTVVGRNEIMAPVRELAVVGGTGRFRMATGYVLLKTAITRGNNYAVIEVDVFLRA